MRPSDQTLNRYREFWHPDFIRELEIIILEETPKEDPLDLEPESPTSDAPQEDVSHNILQPEVLPEAEHSLCHTPHAVAQHNGQSAESLNPLPEERPGVYATPPLYMKVLHWASEQAVLIYQGSTVYSTVELSGEKRPKMQSIKKKQLVTITDYTHSSFLFYPEEEEQLQVYVKPQEDSSHWRSGIPVLAKNLQFLPDG